MAANRRTGPNYPFILFVILFVLDVNVNSQGVPDSSTIQRWTDNLAKKLKDDFKTTTFYDFLKSAYDSTDTLKNNGKQLIQLQFEEVNPEQVIKQASSSLTDMLDEKKAALKRSVEAAEEAASKYQWNSKITTDDIDYVSAKKIMVNDSRLEFNERFKQPVMENVSSVHIPVEIFDGGIKLVPDWSNEPKIPRDVEILNGLAWSANLDSAFKENFARDEEILWQYFGSQTGFMRTFPGSRWKKGPKDVDLYDVRRRPWYTQGSSSPKDMMILIDVSGSVFGQALELIKVSVKSLLDTLGENDFVNIATFSEEADYVTKCFNESFVQANYRNKKILMEAVDNIEAGGMANFELGLTFAFEAFNKLNESDQREGANCNKMIMLLTDGGTEYADDVFKKYNPTKEKKFRVFTYAVGPTANPIAAIKWMACSNRGFFSKIPAMGAIRSKVQEYVDVISRPLALNNVEHELWTSVYPGHAEYMVKNVKAMETYDLDIKDRLKFTISRDPWGLGMMTTVTLPVYNKTLGSSNQTILGVMGVDVTTDKMLQHVPRRKFGPNGFPFAINSNGYIVFHDGLKPQIDIKDPPNVDFLDIEVESPEKEKLRKDMIDMKSGKVVMDTFTVSPDQRHVDREKGPTQRRYYYQAIERTTFSLGLSLPAYHKHYLKVTVNVKELLDEVKDILNATATALLIADWEYYSDFLKNENLTGTVLDLEEALRNPSQLSGDLDLIYHLLWDLKATMNMESYWKLVKGNNFTSEGSAGMQGVFVGTNGGLTRIYPKSAELVEFFLDKRDTWSNTYYKRAIDSDKYIYSAPYVLNPEDNNGTVGNVMVVKAVTVENSSLDPNLNSPPNYKAAVIGAQFSHQSMLDRLLTITSRTFGTQYDCSRSDTIACHLLDDGAFLLVTNQEQFNTSVGRFFGRVDVEVMKDLYNKTVYERLEQYDFQALCSTASDDDTTSAGFTNFNIPSLTLFYEFLTFNWWTSVVTWAFTNFNLYSMLYPSPANQAHAYFHPEKEKPCIKMHAMYYFAENIGVVEGQTEECEVKLLNCSRNYIAAPVEGTNMLLLITEVMKEECKICQTRVDKNELIQEPTKRVPDFCQIKPRYRKSVDKCFDRDPREDDTKCAGPHSHPVSYLVIIVIAMATTVFTMR